MAMSAKQRAAISAGLKRHYAAKGATAEKQRTGIATKKFKGIKLNKAAARLVAAKTRKKRR